MVLVARASGDGTYAATVLYRLRVEQVVNAWIAPVDVDLAVIIELARRSLGPA
jgi:hypothetical protein